VQVSCSAMRKLTQEKNLTAVIFVRRSLLEHIG
jgi:hypothetical protein